MFQPRHILKFIIPLFLLGALIFLSGTAPVRILKNFTWSLIKPVAGLVTKTADKISGPRGTEENGRLQAALFEIEELRLRLAELEKALGFKAESGLTLTGARVVLYTKELGQEYLIVDRGKDDGIREGGLAITSDKVLVGKVKSVEDSFSKIALASNTGETFEVEILPLRISAFAKGLGARTFSLELIPADSPVKRGDFVALSGNHTFLVGEVVQEKRSVNNAFKEVRAVLFAKPQLLKDVFILDSLK